MSYDEIRTTLKNWPKLVRQYQKPNLKKSITQIITSFGPFLVLWTLMYFSLDYSYWLTLGLGIINAFFLVRIFIIQHDCGHQAFFKSKKLNNIIGFICSFASLIPYQYWARSHNFHHAHNGQLEHDEIGDIKTLTVNEFRALSPWKRLLYKLFRFPPILFTVGPIYYLFIIQRLPLIQKKGWNEERWSLIFSNLYFTVFYTALIFIFGWKSFLLVQAPILIFFAIIAVWFFYVQHQHEETYKQWKHNWEYLLASVQGSSYYNLPKLFHWLTGNIGYHHIHHLSPLIPNYNLAKCNAENPILEKYAPKLTFLESLKCMKNRLWDEEQQKMISFREFYRRERKNN